MLANLGGNGADLGLLRRSFHALPFEPGDLFAHLIAAPLQVFRVPDLRTAARIKIPKLVQIQRVATARQPRGNLIYVRAEVAQVVHSPPC